MIKEEDIKVGSYLQIRKFDLEAIAGPNFVEDINKHCSLNTCVVKVVNMTGGMCEIQYSFWCIPAVVDAEELAKVAISSSTPKTANKKTDADRFKEITDKMIDTYKCKNHDYGNAFSEMYDELGINYGYGKIREKVNRIKTLKDKEAQVANEPLEDALLDCANYCILILMEYQKRKEHGAD